MIDQDKVPVNLEEALTILKEGLSAEDIKEFKRPSFSPTQIHFSVGMMLRNLWTLWDKQSRLVLWFKNRYGVDHADDVSAIIIDCLHKDINELPRRDDALAESFIKHWKKSEG